MTVNIKTQSVERVIIRKGRTAEVQLKPAVNSVRIVQTNTLAPSTSQPKWTAIEW